MYRSPIRSLNFGTQPSDEVDEQGMVGDFVDSVQRGFYQGMAGTFESVDQLTGFGGGIRDWLNTQADKQISEMSEAGQNALTQQIFDEDENGNLTFGEGALNGRAWLNYLGQGVGTIGSFIGTGGAGGTLAKGGVKLLATAAGKQALKNAAVKEAAKLGFKGKAKDIVANGAVSVVVGNGMQANSEREKYQNMSFQELQNSPAFSDKYWSLRDDPNNQQYTDEQIGVAARNQLAEDAADKVFYDPKLTAVNTIGGLSGAVGGRGLGITGNIFKPSESLKGGLAKGFIIEGTQEASQGGVETLVSNEVYRDLVDPNFDTSKGVVSSALNEGIIGGVLGGTVSGGEGFMSGRRNRANTNTEQVADPQQEVQQPITEQPEIPTPEQRAVDQPITGNTDLDTEFNRLDDSNQAVSDALAGAKQRKVDNELSARRVALRNELQQRGVLSARNEQQDVLNLARAYDPDRYQTIARELSNPDIDSNPDYANQLEAELFDMAQQANELNIDPLQTAIDRRVDMNLRGERSDEQILRQRLIRYSDNGVVGDVDAAYQQAINREQQPSQEQSVNDVQQRMDADARSKYGIAEDYQPTEAAQRMREEQGIALRDELEYLNERKPAQQITPTDGPIDAAQRVYQDNVQRDIDLNQQSIPARRDMEAARQQAQQAETVNPQQALSNEMLNRLASDRVSNFQNRPASMRLREEGRKPISDYAGMTQKTKGMSKRLKRRIQRAKGFDTESVLSEFQNHEKRLQAFEAEARRQAQVEAAKPENIARRKSAESLFEERMSSPQATAFKENLITEAMNSVNNIVDTSQGTVLEMDGKTVSLPEVKRQLANGVRTLANKFVSKTALINDRLRSMKQPKEDVTNDLPNVQPDPESMQEESQPKQVVQREEPSVNETKEHTSQVDKPDEETTLDEQPSANEEEMEQPTEHAENQPTDKIEDFGEVLHGARKHNWGKFGDAISRDMSKDQIAEEPLSKSLPKPNLKKLSDEGVSNYHLALMTVLRGMIPSKPRKGYKLGKWSDSVDAVRKLSKAIMEKDSYFDSISLHKEPMSELLSKIADDLTLDEIETLGNYEANYYNIAKKFNFKRKKSYGRESIDEDTIEALAPKALALIRNQDPESAGSTTKKRVDMSVYVKRFTGDAFIGVKVGSRVVEIKSGFDSTKDARQYMTENLTALEDEVIARRKDANKQFRSDTNRTRDGIVEREGNVSPEDFTNAFGFRGVQFGNWVEGARRQQDLNNAYDSLVDLSRLMGIPTRGISLNGKLGLAFGARGKGGPNAALAHFEPGTFVINLTKKSGKGSLAHEWFHALDYNFGNLEAASNKIARSANNLDMRPEMQEKWKNLIKAIDDSGMRERSAKLDQLKQQPYWQTKVEMVARAFETWVINENSHQGITNDYLANVLPDDSTDTYPYPTQKELDNGIAQAYSDFVKEIRTESDAEGNVSLYSLYRAAVKPILSDPKREEVESFVKDIFKGSPDLAYAETMVNVVSSERQLPNHIQYQIFNDGVEGKVNGLYDPETKHVYLIADKIPTKEHAERFIFHELVGHHGLRALFGDELKSELANIRNMLGGKSGVLKLARQMGVDLSQYVQMTENAVSNNDISTEQADYILFDELLAHVAERNQVQGAVGRLLQKVKQWLRRHGFTTLSSYGKSDLIELLTNIRTSLGNPPPTKPTKGIKPNTSVNKAYYALDSRPDVDQVLNTKQNNLVKRIKAAIKGVAPIEALGRNKYAMLTLRQMGEVAEFIDKDMGTMIDGYQQEVNSMVSTQNTLAEEAANVSDDLSKWAKKNRKQADQMFEFAHDATLADVDPSMPFQSRTEELTLDKQRLERAYKEYGGSNSERGRAIYEELKEIRELLKQEPGRQKEHLRLKPIWGRLNKEQKAKFREMRDYYIKQGERFDKALEENINRAVQDQKIRKEMLAKLRQRQELRAKGLYFPLSRFGDYWIDFADKNGERQYMMFESKSEMETARDKLRDSGYEVKSGMKAQGNEGQQVSLPFVADVLELIRSSKMNQHNADTLADQVYQMYLRTLPGRSLRRNFIHRKGVEGFSNDAIRVLADNGFKQSRQQARLDL